MNTVYDTEWSTALRNAHARYETGSVALRRFYTTVQEASWREASRQQELRARPGSASDADLDGDADADADSTVDDDAVVSTPTRTPPDGKLGHDSSAVPLKPLSLVGVRRRGAAVKAEAIAGSRLRGRASGTPWRYIISSPSPMEDTLRYGKSRFPNPLLATSSAHHNPLEGLQATCYKCSSCGFKYGHCRCTPVSEHMPCQ